MSLQLLLLLLLLSPPLLGLSIQQLGQSTSKVSLRPLTQMQRAALTSLSSRANLARWADGGGGQGGLGGGGAQWQWGREGPAGRASALVLIRRQRSRAAAWLKWGRGIRGA